MTLTTMKLTVEAGVAAITLDRPDAHNAIDLAFTRDLQEVTARCEERGDVRAVVIEATGRMFTAGGDLSSFGGLDGPDLSALLRRMTGAYHAALVRLARMDAPVIAAVHGAAAGGGLGIVLASDLAVAGRSSSYVLGYSALGLTADGGTTWFLPRVVGLRLAQRMFLLNERLDADQALAAGLVSEVVDDEDVRSRARALAERLAAGPTGAFGQVKRLLHEASTRSMHEHLDAESRSLSAAARTHDGQEGVAAFLDGRRAPDFRGR